MRQCDPESRSWNWETAQSIFVSVFERSKSRYIWFSISAAMIEVLPMKLSYQLDPQHGQIPTTQSDFHLIIQFSHHTSVCFQPRSGFYSATHFSHKYPISTTMPDCFDTSARFRNQCLISTPVSHFHTSARFPPVPDSHTSARFPCQCVIFSVFTIMSHFHTIVYPIHTCTRIPFPHHSLISTPESHFHAIVSFPQSRVPFSHQYSIYTPVPYFPTKCRFWLKRRSNVEWFRSPEL